MPSIGRSRRARLANLARVGAVILLGAGFLLPSAAGQEVQGAPRAVAPIASGPAAVVPNPDAGNEWTTFLHGVYHDSDQSVPESLTAANASGLSLLWTFPTHGKIVSQPAVSNGSVYFGSWDGNEYSVNASNGTLRWATYLGQSQCLANTTVQGVSSSATVVNHRVYVGGGGTYWDALSQSTGSILWNVYTGNSSPVKGGGHYNWASPLVYGGYAYVGIASHCDLPLVRGMILKVNLATHAVSRSFNLTTMSDLGASVWSSPALNPMTGVLFAASGNLFTGTNSTLDDSILAFNATTLRLLSHFQVPYLLRNPDGDFGASPTLYTDSHDVPLVVDANKDGYLFALNQNRLSAGPVWQDRISTGRSYSSAAYENGTLYVGSGTIRYPNGSVLLGSIQAINGTTGKVRWMIPMPGNVFGPVVVAGDVVVGAGGKQLVVAKTTDGRVLFRYNASGPFQSGPSIAGGRIFIGDTNGDLFSFGFPLVAHLSAHATKGRALTEAFPLRVSGGAGGFRYSWSFGDGAVSALTTAVHTYAAPGNYTIRVVVSDQAWSSVTAQVTVVVSSPTGGAGPRARVSASVGPGRSALTVPSAPGDPDPD